MSFGISGCAEESPPAAALGQTQPEVHAAVVAVPDNATTQAWIIDAGGLITAAGSGRADAREFKRQVERSREALRDMMLGAPEGERERFNDLVLMVALLDAAAACHKAGYIICPPDLMQQLRAQQGRLQTLFGMPA
ncbi:MAG: hypothetical protein ACFCUG_06000 [Thiotrichales bacterium]